VIQCQNIHAEKTNQTKWKRLEICCRMSDAINECGQKLNTAVYLKNRSPHKAIRGATPEEIWTGKKIDLSYLKVFGCIYQYSKDSKKKMDAKGKPHIRWLLQRYEMNLI